MAFLMDPTMQEFKLKHLLLKLFEITISYHSSGVNTLQCHFMYKNLFRFLVVNFIVAFYTMFVRYIYVLQKQNKINKT